jgi:hypothetical protein
MEALILFAILAVGVAAFDLAAWLWGVYSADGVNSQEWERRRQWRGFKSGG